MVGSRLKKRNPSDTPSSPISQSKSSSSQPSSPDVKTRHTIEPYPVPSSNPASQYTLLEKLGTGSFGTVYKAMHNESKQIVAIKQIGPFTFPFRSIIHMSLSLYPLSSVLGYQ